MELPEPDKNESIESAPKKTSIFPASSSGGLFPKSTTGGLFNKDIKPTTSIFGSNSSKPSGGPFGTAKSETKNAEGSSTSLFTKSGEGSNKDANPAETKPSGSGMFGKIGDSKPSLFGNNSSSKPGLFGSSDNKEKGSLLFGSLSKPAEAKAQPSGDEKKESVASGGILTAKTGLSGGSLFPSSTSKPQDSTKSSGSIFGDKKPENSNFQ